MKRQLKPLKNARILIFDIETLPNLCATWGIHKQFITMDDIVEERSLISVHWRWFGEDKTTNTVSLLDDKARLKKSVWDDTVVVKKLHELLSEADIIVGHNVKNYDFPMLNGRALFHKLPVLPQPRFIDTLVIAKSRFRLNSNKLDYLAKILGLKVRKLEMRKKDWMEIIYGHFARDMDLIERKLRKFVTYGSRDVDITTEVFLRLNPHALPQHTPNANVFINDGVARCRVVTCGSDDLKLDGTRSTNAGLYQRYRCKCCGSYGQFPTNLLHHRPIAR